VPSVPRTTSIPGFVVAAWVLALALTAVPLREAASAEAGAAHSAGFTAVADAFITGARPDTNFGQAKSLRVNAREPAQTYLRFRIRRLADGIVNAHLRMYITRGSGVGYEVYGSTGRRWTESSIDYNNAPVRTERIAGSGPVGTGWSEVDVSGLVASDGVYTLVVTTSDPGGLRFLSKETGSFEANAGARPRKTKRSPEIVVTNDPAPDTSPSPSPDPPSSPTDTVAACLGRPSISVLPANPTAAFTGTFPSSHTFDARSQTNRLYPWTTTGPIDVTTGSDPCVVGGVSIGQQSRDMSWEDVKSIGGSAVRIRHPGGAQVYGIQAENQHDGFRFRATSPASATSGDGWMFAHSWMRYNRDDCIENDHLTSGTVRDVLWECFVGVSAQDVHDVAPDQSNERIVFEDVLIQLTEMPSAQYGMDHGHLLKWSSFAPRPVIRNSVILIEDNAAGEWPPGTVLENVTLVWDPASGSAPSLDPMPGLTITTDESVWETAKADWLARHGCTSFGNCTRLTDPTPI
jgi:hypothetical protein